MNMPGYWNVVRVNNWRYGCGGTREKSLRVNASASLIQMGVPQGSQQHPAMQIRNIMVQGADFRVSRLYETRKPKTIHVVAQVADVLRQSLHVRRAR